MKIYIKSFTIAISIIWILFILITSMWSRVSSSYGIEFMLMYHSIHPHPYLITRADLLMIDHIWGILLDVFYAFIDSMILGLSFGMIYNYLIDKIEIKS